MFGQRKKRILTGAGIGGGLSAVLTGAAVGAVAGTMGFPGIGTLVGAVMGALIAGVATGAIFGSIYDKAKPGKGGASPDSTPSREEAEEREDEESKRPRRNSDSSIEDGEEEADKAGHKRDPVMVLTPEKGKRTPEDCEKRIAELQNIIAGLETKAKRLAQKNDRLAVPEEIGQRDLAIKTLQSRIEGLETENKVLLEGNSLLEKQVAALKDELNGLRWQKGQVNELRRYSADVIYGDGGSYSRMGLLGSPSSEAKREGEGPNKEERQSLLQRLGFNG